MIQSVFKQPAEGSRRLPDSHAQPACREPTQAGHVPKHWSPLQLCWDPRPRPVSPLDCTGLQS